MPWVQILAVAALGAVIAGAIMVAYARRHLADEVYATRAEASAAVQKALSEAKAAARAAETDARNAALEEAEALEAECSRQAEKLASREERIEARAAEVSHQVSEIEERAAEIDARFAASKQTRDSARRLRKEIREQKSERIEKLAGVTGLDPDAVASSLGASWLEDARTEAAHAVRAVEQAAADGRFIERANRLLEIAVGRYRNHFLTERSISLIRLSGPVAELLTANGNAVADELAAVANVTFNFADSGDSLRLEGLDGVGREVARRALSRLNKKPEHLAKARQNPTEWTAKIKTNLEREIIGLGKKAFSVLEIPKPHPEIVDLVGRLNYRTSYTQNQWLHAVEASFLASMIGDEMGLDRKLIRRATLMHDIGKALTHLMEGSHAVIGADIARRLGEDEIVANAIGSHHSDEPPNSVYAFLVAGADAMSGARPGARREHTEGYSSRLKDMERIGARHQGVDRCFAVHGGRELRVYVEEKRVSDLQAVELSSAIAKEISDEMTFPGQIKVTVIRASECVSIAS